MGLFQFSFFSWPPSTNCITHHRLTCNEISHSSGFPNSLNTEIRNHWYVYQYSFKEFLPITTSLSSHDLSQRVRFHKEIDV